VILVDARAETPPGLRHGLSGSQNDGLERHLRHQNGTRLIADLDRQLPLRAPWDDIPCKLGERSRRLDLYGLEIRKFEPDIVFGEAIIITMSK
jgi:hypothetical protein